MKFRLLTAVAVVLLVAMPAAGSSSSADGAIGETQMAIFEGAAMDISNGWGHAQACAVWDKDAPVECFRSETELLERVAELGLDGSDGIAAAGSTCSSSLKLYDGTSYTGSALYLYQRTSWINLSNYGWANRTSSYKIGACSAYFADYSDGGGSWYPTSYTEAWDQSSAMISGWNNRVSSVFIR